MSPGMGRAPGLRLGAFGLAASLTGWRSTSNAPLMSVYCYALQGRFVKGAKGPAALLFFCFEVSGPFWPAGKSSGKVVFRATRGTCPCRPAAQLSAANTATRKVRIVSYVWGRGDECGKRGVVIWHILWVVAPIHTASAGTVAPHSVATSSHSPTKSLSHTHTTLSGGA